MSQTYIWLTCLTDLNVTKQFCNALDQVTDDISDLTYADIFSSVGKRTGVIVRFSIVSASVGSPEWIRDPRGFAVKFYAGSAQGGSKQGCIWDLVGNNFPVGSPFLAVCETLPAPTGCQLLLQESLAWLWPSLSARALSHAARLLATDYCHQAAPCCFIFTTQPCSVNELLAISAQACTVCQKASRGCAQVVGYCQNSSSAANAVWEVAVRSPKSLCRCFSGRTVTDL